MNIREQCEALKKEVEDLDGTRRTLAKTDPKRLELWHMQKRLERQVSDMMDSREYQEFCGGEIVAYQESMRPKLEAFLVDYKAICEKHGVVVAIPMLDRDAVVNEASNEEISEEIDWLLSAGWHKHRCEK